MSVDNIFIRMTKKLKVQKSITRWFGLLLFNLVSSYVKRKRLVSHTYMHSIEYYVVITANVFIDSISSYGVMKVC